MAASTTVAPSLGAAAPCSDGHADGHAPSLTADEFAWFTGFLRTYTGIELRPGKERLVMARLHRRVSHHQARTYSEYFQRLGRAEDPEETRIALDLMTTNETYLFREPHHFDLLATLAAQAPSTRPFRVWSAACSSGEEVYSIALTLRSTLRERPWEVLGTDLSRPVLEGARRGLYPPEDLERVPAALRQHCRRVRVGDEDYLSVSREVRERVAFARVNLTRPLPQHGAFDVIFLRNVLIYFRDELKHEVCTRLAQQLRPGGSLVLGSAEVLTDFRSGLTRVEASRYVRDGRAT